MDPESGLDAVVDVGIDGGTVAAVSSEPLDGTEVVDVSGLVVAPGFIASDGVGYIDGRAHPRGAGTFARVLGRYVRDQRRLSLMEAIRKMTLDPARRLEAVAPAMRKKGRVAVGADADITVFDLETVADRATFAEPAVPSAGIPHVLVDGVFVVRDGELVEGALPGRGIRSAAFDGE